MWKSYNDSKPGDYVSWNRSISLKKSPENSNGDIFELPANKQVLIIATFPDGFDSIQKKGGFVLIPNEGVWWWDW